MKTTLNPTRNPRRRPGRLARSTLALAAAVAAGALLVGCSGGGLSSGGGSDSAADSVEPASGGAAEAPREFGDGQVSGVDGKTESAGFQLQERAIISKGAVMLRSDDVAKARFDAQKVADQFGGEITDEQSDTGKDGKLATVRLVVRVPSADFTEALAAFEEVGELTYSHSSSEDVTTQVIDVEVRISAQRRSIARIETLLDRARNLRDIVLIEGELTRRQAELDSLEQQSAFLEDQTSFSTITVNLERTKAKATKDDDSGFLAGLASGWDGLTSLTVGAVTVVGVLLPFTLVLLALGLAGLPIVRRLRTPRPTAAPAPAQASE